MNTIKELTEENLEKLLVAFSDQYPIDYHNPYCFGCEHSRNLEIVNSSGDKKTLRELYIEKKQECEGKTV